MDKLYDKCTDLIVWYGSDYLQLDEISRRKDFFNLIEQGIRDPCCEIYIIIKKMKHSSNSSSNNQALLKQFFSMLFV